MQFGYLKKSTLLALAGACYLFLSRTIGTYWPELFINPYITRTNAIISLLASSTFLLLYILIFRTFALPGRPIIKEYNSPLRNATITVIVGTLLIIPLFLENTAMVFWNFNVFFIELPQPLRLFLILGSSICSLYFAAVFYTETLSIVSNRLSRAVKFLIFGAVAGLVIRTYVVLNYYYPNLFRSSGELNKELPITTILILVFIFFSNIYFLWTFFKELRAIPKNTTE